MFWVRNVIILIAASGIINCKLNGELLNKSDHILREISLISSNIMATLEPEHCYTIVTDHIYDKILTGSFYNKFPTTTFFLIKVNRSEDLLSPNYKTVKSLLEIQRSGCNVYLILISNGLQVGRFLKFTEKFRILSTRAYYIVLHDYRLFVREFYYLWKRFVNIVFIRDYSHCNKGKHLNGTLFELSTVPFPKPINDIFVTKRLDFWRNGKFRTGTKLFFPKTGNLKGKLMKTAVLEHTPAVFKLAIQNNTEYYGVEVELIKALSVALNFNIKFYESYDTAKEQWGHKLENGTVTGLYGELVNDHSDFGLGDLHYTQYNLELIDLSIPYSTECLTFLTPEALSDNSWKLLILPFRANMWIGVLTSLFCGGFIFYGLSKTYKFINSSKLTKENEVTLFCKKGYYSRAMVLSKDIFENLSTSIMYTYSMLLVVSLPRLPKCWPIRLLTGWYWIYCLLITVAYRSSMTAILALPVPRITIDTLQQLADSSIACGTWGEENKQFFTTSLDEAGQKIGTKLEQTDDINYAVLIEQIIKGKYAYYENEYYLKDIRSKRNSKAEQETLHIMKECVIHMPVSLGLQKNSPIKPLVDKYLRNIIESGLLAKWLSDVTTKFESDSDLKSYEQGFMDLTKMYGAFVSLFIGYGLGLLTLIVENLYWKFMTQRDPNYDKLISGGLYNLKRSPISHN